MLSDRLKCSLQIAVRKLKTAISDFLTLLTTMELDRWCCIRINNVRHLDESRFLRKNWLSYWEHEVGRSENASFSFKQIHLQSFPSNIKFNF